MQKAMYESNVNKTITRTLYNLNKATYFIFANIPFIFKFM